MVKLVKHIKQQMHTLKGVLAGRIELFSFFRKVLPVVFFRDINYLPYLKKVPLFLLITLVIASFIITSMPHIFLA